MVKNQETIKPIILTEPPKPHEPPMPVEPEKTSVQEEETDYDLIPDEEILEPPPYEPPPGGEGP